MALALQPMITKTISHYEILAAIAEGGMGVVYRAVDTRLGRPVAIKVLRHDGGPIPPETRKRFVQEARAASALNHPHIVTVYEIGGGVDDDFIAMEYVSGRSLAQIGRNRVPVADALKYAVQIADALAAAHGAGILHRDLKPANIMVSDKGSIKVLDFGIAKLTESADFHAIDERARTETALEAADLQTEEGTVLGTAAYMSPEQAEGRPADARSDVFSFGAVLYELITGRRPFAGDTRMSTLAAILTKEPGRPGEDVPDLPRDLEKLIMRCLRKDPDRRWQSMADLKVALEDLQSESESTGAAIPALPAARWSVHPLLWTLAVTAIGALVAGAWWRTSSAPPPPERTPSLTRLTSDAGWTDYPVVSLDGKILAYASDRGGDGNLDIWVQQLPEGPPLRLTRHAADDVEPAMSADGNRIAFRSSRMGGGIYVVPTFGGEERLLAAGGYLPRFSPDGKWIAYGVSEQGGSALYLAPAAGGPATLVAPDFYRTQAHVWSPDGQSLLFWAQRRRDAAPEDNVDWYVVAVPNGSPVRIQARGLLLREKFRAFQGLPFPDAWTAAGNRILFHASAGDSSNIWQVALSPDNRQLSARPQRATFGTTEEAAASITTDGRLVFISRTTGADLWSLPIDSNRGSVSGPLTRVTADAADDYDPSLADDGVTLVFRSRRAGQFAVVLRRLDTGAETILTRMPEDHYPAISRDGTRVAYSFSQDGKMPVFVVAASGGTPEQVCDDCGQVEAWSPTGDRILYVAPRDPSGVGLLRLGAPRDDAWLSHPGYGLYNPRLSPDGAWIAFNGRTDRLSPSRVFLAKVDGAAVSSEKDWIGISQDGDAPAWSPHGNFLYFWSARDGSPCLWAQRVDASTKRPIGEPLGVQHFHGRGLSWKNLYLGTPDIVVARDRIIFNLGEHTGNVWMTELPSPRR